MLVNESTEDFITADQPIINIHPDLKGNDFSPPGENVCDFFYPISPKIAFMINKSDTFPSGISDVRETFVHEVNNKMAKKSERIIFGTSKEQVMAYSGSVGEVFRAMSAFHSSR